MQSPQAISSSPWILFAFSWPAVTSYLPEGFGSFRSQMQAGEDMLLGRRLQSLRLSASVKVHSYFLLFLEGACGPQEVELLAERRPVPGLTPTAYNCCLSSTPLQPPPCNPRAPLGGIRRAVF